MSLSGHYEFDYRLLFHRALCLSLSFTVSGCDLISFLMPLGSALVSVMVWASKLEVDIDLVVPNYQQRALRENISTLGLFHQLLSKYARAGHDSLWSGYG